MTLDLSAIAKFLEGEYVLGSCPKELKKETLQSRMGEVLVLHGPQVPPEMTLQDLSELLRERGFLRERNYTINGERYAGVHISHLHLYRKE